MYKQQLTYVLFFLFVVILVACQDDAPVADGNVAEATTTVTETISTTPETTNEIDVESTAVATAVPSPIPSATPLPMKEIVVCMSTPPQDIYLYGDNSPAATAVRHAVYENLYTTLAYDYQAQGLTKLPSLADGDAITQTVTVAEGDRVVDVNGTAVTLFPDIEIIDAQGQQITFNGSPIEMVQMVVDFTFQPLVWSDGIPVTAADSVYSYNVAASPETTAARGPVLFTADYVATAENSVRWTGLPGYLNQNYMTHVWTPLPQHQLEDIPVRQLRDAAEAAQVPLSSGPYVVNAWTDDQEIILQRNPHYYRAEAGLPAVGQITLRFGTAEAHLGADCDVITPDLFTVADIATLSTDDRWQMLTKPGDVFEQISFGVRPVSEYAERRPDWFGNTQVRQAMTMCTDRQRMIDELTAGEAAMMHAFVPPSHPLLPTDLQEWPYDPVAANDLLDAEGYLDYADDGRRQDVASGVPMTITLGIERGSALRQRITEIFQENMDTCGIPVDLYDIPAGSWYEAGPQGRIFGRRFDLAEFAWINSIVPNCGLFLTENIPGPREFGFGGWRNINVTGWSLPEYDTACRSALAAMPGGAGFTEAHQEALRIFADELPLIPLFTNVKVAAVRPDVAQIILDPSQPSMLWNVFEWDKDE